MNMSQRFVVCIVHQNREWESVDSHSASWSNVHLYQSGSWDTGSVKADCWQSNWSWSAMTRRWYQSAHSSCWEWE